VEKQEFWSVLFFAESPALRGMPDTDWAPDKYILSIWINRYICKVFMLDLKNRSVDYMLKGWWGRWERVSVSC
jgi:hypothetical protein